MNTALFLVVAATARAQGPCPTPIAVVQTDLDAAWRAYIDDVDTLAPRADMVWADVRCAEGPLSRDLVLRLLVLASMRAFVERSPEVLEAVAAVKALEPGFRPPEEIAPAGGSLRRLYETTTSSSPVAALPTIPATRWWIDGVAEPVPVLPLQRTVLVQREDLQTRTTTTWWFPGGGASIEALGLPAALTEAPPPGPALGGLGARVASAQPGWWLRQPAHRRTLLVSAAATFAGSAALYGTAAASRASYLDAPLNDPALELLADVNLSATVGAGVTFLCALALTGGTWGVHTPPSSPPTSEGSADPLMPAAP